MREELKDKSVHDCVHDIQETAQELLRSVIGELPSCFSNIDTVYDSIIRNEYPYNKVDSPYIKDAIAEYLSYIDGMEDFVILTFKINEGELNQSSVDKKMDVVMDKDLGFISGLTEKTRKISINDAMRELESVIDFAENILTFSEAIEDCATAVSQQLGKDEPVQLKVAKIKAFCLYVTSLMRFCSSVSYMAMDISNKISGSMKSRTSVSGEKDETILKIV